MSPVDDEVTVGIPDLPGIMKEYFHLPFKKDRQFIYEP
ncbi:MAG: hypothetical protein BWY45_01469 [Euryarchaeota archaeon ADurb.Bin294]|nr:MAG: hypothetical protein BWY45_01469 [Euryarchaeota archaeon ADurb.Bin294]